MYIFTAQSTAMINLNTSYGTLSCDKVPEGVGISLRDSKPVQKASIPDKPIYCNVLFL